jgi:hypothetical protein
MMAAAAAVAVKGRESGLCKSCKKGGKFEFPSRRQIVATSIISPSSSFLLIYTHSLGESCEFQNHKFVFFIFEILGEKRESEEEGSIPNGENIINLFHFLAFILCTLTHTHKDASAFG